jgi:hypothetical protein
MPIRSPATLWRLLQSRLRSWTRWDAWRRRPFIRLVEHFAAGITRPDNNSEVTGIEIGGGALLGLLAAPGGIVCLLLLDKYSSFIQGYFHGRRIDIYLESIPDKYFLLSLSMAVTGIITVLKWDKILPDRQDYLNLAPLPITQRAMFFANSAAVLLAVAALTLAVNAGSILGFPVVVTANEISIGVFFRFAAVHALCVLLASVFTFCAIFSLMGTLMTVLPASIFSRISLWVRGAIVTVLIGALATGFAGEDIVRYLHKHPDSAVRFLPTVWYLGLYQVLQGRETAELVRAASQALWNAGAAIVLAMIVYPLSYQRALLGTIGRSRGVVTRRGAGMPIPYVPSWSPFDRACYGFALRTLFRSDIHCLCVAAFLSVGVILGLQTLMYAHTRIPDPLPGVRLLSVPLIVAYLLICGLRLAFELPAGLSANWIFRTMLEGCEHASARVARNVMVTFLVPLVVIPCAVLYSIWWGAWIGVLHAGYVFLVSLALIEVFVFGYRKIPFTAPLPAMQNHMLLVCLVQFLGLLAFSRIGAAVERSLMESPTEVLLVPCAVAGAWLWKRRHAQGVDRRLLFEDVVEPEVQGLQLSDTG